MAIVVVSKMNDRLDRICYAHYGSVANRQVEQVLNANPGLEQQPILLEDGIEITLPDIATTTKTPVVIQISLWD